MLCRFCNTELNYTFLDLGTCPPSNSYLNSIDDIDKEKSIPLLILLCENCWLLQTKDFEKAHELFMNDYAYFSSTSKTFLDHAKQFSIKIIRKLNINNTKMVVEIASNDGYLLTNFIKKGIPCLGVEPTLSTATFAKNIGVPTINQFFSKSLSIELKKKGYGADLIVANNVYAHVPEINDFTAGLKILLNEGGTVCIEFPHLLNLIKYKQFDTIYHEHYSYLSIFTVSQILHKHRLRIIDVEEIPTHGGSVRVYCCHNDDMRASNRSVKNIINAEKKFGLQSIDAFKSFMIDVDKVANDLKNFLIDQKKQGKIVVGFGAAAKANTLLNYTGIGYDLIPFICDSSLSKQGKLMPGSHIPIKSPEILKNSPPDYLLIFPWNIADEIIEQNNFLRKHKTKFLLALPSLKIIE